MTFYRKGDFAMHILITAVSLIKAILRVIATTHIEIELDKILIILGNLLIEILGLTILVFLLIALLNLKKHKSSHFLGV
jgi:hypothetical protein